MNWCFTDNELGRGGNSASFGLTVKSFKVWYKTYPNETLEEWGRNIAAIESEVGYDSSIIFDRSLTQEQMRTKIESLWRTISRRRVNITI